MTSRNSAIVSVIVSTTCLLWGATVHAQPCEPAPEPCVAVVCEIPVPCTAPPVAMPAPPPVVRPILPAPTLTYKGLHRHLLDSNEDYRSARRRRTGGIVLAAVGGSLGMLVGIAGSAAWSEGEEDARGAAIGGLAVGITSLAVGISMAVSGQREMREIRQAYLPRIGLAVGPGTGHVQAAWQF
jgi:hypothetical protein